MDSVSLNEALIAAVQERPPLYDKSEDNYSNRVYINRQWQEIGREIGIHEQAAKKKWTTLRDYFQKSHRQLTLAKSESGGERQKKWYLYDSMLFLLPHISERSTILNLAPELQVDTGKYQDTKSRSPSPLPTPSTSSLAEDSEISLPPTSTSTRSCRKRRFLQDRSGANSLDEKMLESISSFGLKLTKEETDEDVLFCKSLVSKIKSLDPFSKMECQAEVQMVILKYMRRSAAQDSGDNLTTTEPIELKHDTT